MNFAEQKGAGRQQHQNAADGHLTRGGQTGSGCARRSLSGPDDDYLDDVRTAGMDSCRGGGNTLEKQVQERYCIAEGACWLV